MSESTVLSMPSEGSDDERLKRLMGWERRVEEYGQSWLFGAQALKEISDGALYALRGHASFRAYVKARFGMSGRHATDLIAAYRVAETVREVSHQLSLKAALTLGQAPQEMRPELLSETIKAAGHRHPTAKQIAAVIAPHLAAKPKRKKKPNPLRPAPLKLPGGVLRIILKRGVSLRSLLQQALAQLPAEAAAA